MLSGVDEVIFNRRGVKEPAEGGGEGSARVVWRITPSGGHSAGAKRVELHPSGSWCNDIRNVEISFLV